MQPAGFRGRVGPAPAEAEAGCAGMGLPVLRSTLAREEARGLLPAPEKVGTRAGETESQQGEGESDVADRLERAPAVTAEL